MTQPCRASLPQALAPLRASETAQPQALTCEAVRRLARQYNLTPREVELAALRLEIPPERYRRNLGTVGYAGQIALLQARVAIVGAGGLGGWVIESLARMGVGQLDLFDGDVFEEGNLNRQLGCTEATLGRSKVQVLAERVAQVNSAVSVNAHVLWVSNDNAADILSGVDLVVDALDTLPARFVVQRAATALGIPLVHGAIAGYTGQVMTILPGDAGLEALYGPGPYPERGIEVDVGNPSATPMMVAAWQAQQVVKLLTGATEGLLRMRLMLLDAQAGDVTIIALGE
jgi:molybdopterin-synthase adenylyltransferase